jgi:hypothetical protein
MPKPSHHVLSRIDCALDACAAAVLESQTGTIIASQTPSWCAAMPKP